MTRNGRDIWQYGISRPVQTGINIEPLVDGAVPEYEAREAAVYCHYTPVAFAELPYHEKALCIAQYRISRLVELQRQDAVNTKMDIMSRQRRR